jgi:TetR/AcrR family transcriptional regulator, mexJK operon transcriptional repressor
VRFTFPPIGDISVGHSLVAGEFMSDTSGLPAARRGRPRVEDIEELNEHILRVASEVFLRYGFDGATVDSIAAAARISKRTLYARYADKQALFRAVLDDLIARWLVPIDRFRSSEDDLATTLVNLGHHLATFLLEEHSIGVNRVVISESERWPELGRMIIETAEKPAISMIEAILVRHQKELRKIDLKTAAEQFLSLMADNLLRRAHLGARPTSHEIDRWVHASVDLFLRGIRRER